MFQVAVAIYTSQMVLKLADSDRRNNPSPRNALTRTLDLVLFRVEGNLMVRGTLRSDIAVRFLDAYFIYSWDKADGKWCPVDHGATELLESGSEAIQSRRVVSNKRRKIVVRYWLGTMSLMRVPSRCK